MQSDTLRLTLLMSPTPDRPNSPPHPDDPGVPDDPDDVPPTPPTEPPPTPIRDPKPEGQPEGPYISRIGLSVAVLALMAAPAVAQSPRALLSAVEGITFARNLDDDLLDRAHALRREVRRVYPIGNTAAADVAACQQLFEQIAAQNLRALLPSRRGVVTTSGDKVALVSTGGWSSL